MPAIYSASVGDTLWEASSSDNYKPFYDSYDEYAEEGFRVLKDGTILPEFRISEKMDQYIAAMSDLQYTNYDPYGFFTAYLSDESEISNLLGLDPQEVGLKLQNGLLGLTAPRKWIQQKNF